jgi:hypothetical protein
MAKPTRSPGSLFIPREASGSAISRLHSSSVSRGSSSVPSISRDTCAPLLHDASTRPFASRASSWSAPSADTAIA